MQCETCAWWDNSTNQVMSIREKYVAMQPSIAFFSMSENLHCQTCMLILCFFQESLLPASFCSVVVITFASHAKGPRFETGQKQTFDNNKLLWSNPVQVNEVTSFQLESPVVITSQGVFGILLKKSHSSPSGNQTTVFHVTGVATVHYTNKDLCSATPALETHGTTQPTKSCPSVRNMWPCNLLSHSSACRKTFVARPAFYSCVYARNFPTS